MVWFLSVFINCILWEWIMSTFDYYKKEMKIDSAVISFVNSIQDEVKDRFGDIDELAEYNQARVLGVFAENRVAQRHFAGSSGYGYGDDGRDTLDKLFAGVFGTEDAIVRPHWTSGSHVLSDGLFALLRPGCTLLSITGRPYDTLEDVIGYGKHIPGSLRDWGVNYKEIPLNKDGSVGYDNVKTALADQSVRVVFMQRSRGYGWRKSLSVNEIEQAVKFVKSLRDDVFIMVDNCYGEFTETREPGSAGADLTVGSLIKNPGGGLAPTGAYAAGTKEAIELMAGRLTSPSLGREVGSYQYGYMPYYQGLFLAPHIVGESLKGTVLAGRVFEKLGYSVLPGKDDPRTDIIQSIRFNTAEELILFCQALQEASPIDSHVVPYPWDMPGYNHQVIMAAGTFVQGASIELSADAPIVEPYIVYMQGGLTYSHVKLAVMKILTTLKTEGYIRL